MHGYAHFWLDPKFWVAVSFVLFFVLFGRKVFSALMGALDKRAEGIRTQLDEAAKLRADANSVAGRLGSLELTIARTTGGEGRLYGSVTSKDIEAALKAKGFEIDRKKLHVDSIRALGTYEVTAKLAHEVSGTFKVHVVAAAAS